MDYKHSMPFSIAFALLGCLAFTQAVTFEVKAGNSTCIKAELNASFLITYSTTNGSRSVRVPLPDSAVVGSGSLCGSDASPPQLVVTFGDGHALGLAFITDDNHYNVSNLSLQYSLRDGTLFPESTSNATITVATTSVGISAQVNTTYRCVSASLVAVGNATVTFSQVKLEAYMPGDDLSSNESVCAADQALTTSAPPRTTAVTTAPAPTPPGTPEQGEYSLLNSNGTVCLLARMALQLNVSYISATQNKTVHEIFNLQPNKTTTWGLCEPDKVNLRLTEESTSLEFLFSLNSTSNKYFLAALILVANWPDMTGELRASNFSLDFLRGTLGRSYMCSAEQTLFVVPDFSLNTFHLQVQPFGLTGKSFSSAEECQLDEDNMLIPIIVGAALAGLVLIVLVAYLIGRKRSHAGYQTI